MYDLAIIGGGVAVNMAMQAIDRLDSVAISYLPDTSLPNERFDYFQDCSIFFDKAFTKGLYIATPVNTHAKFVERGVLCGVPCLVEKPALLSTEELSRIPKAAEQFAAMSFKKRFSPLASAILEQRQAQPKSKCMLDYVYLAPHPGTDHWKVNPVVSGGGAMMDVGSHVLDFIEHCLGQIESIQITDYKESEKGFGDTYVAAEVVFDNQAKARFKVGWATNLAIQKVNFVQGDVQISWVKSDHQDSGKILSINRHTASELNYSRQQEYSGLFDAFFDWVEGRDSKIPRWSEGVRNLELIEMVGRSCNKFGCAGGQLD